MSRTSWADAGRRMCFLSVTLVLMVTAVPTAAGAKGAVPAVTLDRVSGLLDGQRVVIKGTGFQPGAPVFTVECNNTGGQPTVQGPSDLPVGCAYGFGPLDGFGQGYTPVANDGTLTTTLVVHTGIIGPTSLGIDSAGHNAAADAAAYPCPPTATQAAGGATCTVRVVDVSGVSATASISFGTPINAAPSLSLAPAAGLTNGQTVKVTASGLTPDSPYVVVECNLTPGEAHGYSLPDLPVGCTNPLAFLFPPVPSVTVAPGGPSGLSGPPPPPLLATTGASGSVATTFAVRLGNLGGTQESGAYPCPPTAANIAAGGSCALVIEDAAVERAQATITVTGPAPAPTIVVLPAGGLVDGAKVGVQGWNFSGGSAGGVLECNDTPGQPTIAVSGVPAPVGCTNPFNGSLLSPAPDGTVGATFSVRTGIVGPVADGTDSAGHAAASDAAAYPCPPTRAQQAAGAACQIVVGDLAGDVARQTIGFAGESPGGGVNPAVGLANGAGHAYWTAARDGGVFAYRGAPFLGSLPSAHHRPGAPVVGIAATPDGNGYWLAGADGGVYTFGTARFFGSLPGSHVKPSAPIMGIAPTPDGQGYWLAGSDGGVFAFGDALFYGSFPSLHAQVPGLPALTFTGVASAPDGTGYWLSPTGNLGFPPFGFGSASGGFPGKPPIGVSG